MGTHKNHAASGWSTIHHHHHHRDHGIHRDCDHGDHDGDHDGDRDGV